MKLSAPVYRLKRNAKLLSRQKNIPLHAALDSIAVQEGFKSWSALAASRPQKSPIRDLFAWLRPGELLLLGARPGQGKTLMSLELAIEATRSGVPSYFFTLEYNEEDVRSRLSALTADTPQFTSLFHCDTSDDIDADYIKARLTTAPRGTVAVIDYLQILDQNRAKPDLSAQVSALKSFARDRGLIIIFSSQIDRSYDPTVKRVPDLEDVRLPNPLDLRLFNKACFLNDGETEFRAVG